MDPFNLFWKTVAGLEKIMNYPVRTEWVPNTQSGHMILGGIEFKLVRAKEGDGVEVWREKERFVTLDKALDKFMIADAMEFILAEVTE